MAKGKLNLELIQRPAPRASTFKKRKEGLTKKLRELCVLCDVAALLVCFGPKGEVVSWPSDRPGFAAAAQRYRQAAAAIAGGGNDDEWLKRNPHDHAGYIEAENSKLSAKLARHRSKLASRIAALSPELLRALAVSLEMTLQSIRHDIAAADPPPEQQQQIVMYQFPHQPLLYDNRFLAGNWAPPPLAAISDGKTTFFNNGGGNFGIGDHGSSSTGWALSRDLAPLPPDDRCGCINCRRSSIGDDAPCNYSYLAKEEGGSAAADAYCLEYYPDGGGGGAMDLAGEVFPRSTFFDDLDIEDIMGFDDERLRAVADQSSIVEGGGGGMRPADVGVSPELPEGGGSSYYSAPSPAQDLHELFWNY